VSRGGRGRLVPEQPPVPQSGFAPAAGIDRTE
jgi:hypothetical protein